MKIKKLVLGIAVGMGILSMQSCGNKAVHVERSAEFNKDQKTIMKELASFKGFVKWSPWSKIDTAMKVDFAGEDGAVGSKYLWESQNEDVGTGSMEITAITENRIDERLVFTNPWESVSSVYYETEPTENGTKVTWGYDGEMPTMMTWFIDMDEMLGGNYEKGLATFGEYLKTLKDDEVLYDGYKVEEITLSPRKYLAKREKVSFSDLKTFYTTQFNAIMGAAHDKGLKMSGNPAGLFYEYNEEEAYADMAAAVPFDGENVAVDDFETIEMGGEKALQIVYYGDYANSGKAHYAMEKVLKERHVVPSLVMEEFVTDPSKEADTSKWQTKVIYVIN